jgi:hypothetical protein
MPDTPDIPDHPDKKENSKVGLDNYKEQFAL